MSFLCLPVLLLAAPGSPQSVGGASELLYQWDSPWSSAAFGDVVSPAGDVNADNVEDILVSAPLASFGGTLYWGGVFLYSGADGTLLMQKTGQHAFDRFGSSLAPAGDLNHDGFDDFYIGAQGTNPGNAWGTGSVYAVSGADGSLLFQWDGTLAYGYFGKTIANAGDINGDGTADLVVGAPAANYLGYAADIGVVYAYSGADGSLLFQWSGLNVDDLFGYCVSAAGDLNADGFDDVLVGAPGVTTGYLEEGRAIAYSGADGSVLYEWDGQNQFAHFGTYVTAIGDCNQDGHADIAVSESESHATKVILYSGADGLPLFHWDGLDFSSGLQSVAHAGDVNGDGIEDILAGAYHRTLTTGSEHSVVVYSGQDGSIINQWRAPSYGDNSGDGFGRSIASAGDLNGDGLDDVVIGSYRDYPAGDSGSTYVMSFHPFLIPSTTSISGLSGGTLFLQLDFPEDAALDRYKVLISETGHGPTHYGIAVPLTLDTLLYQTFVGFYPVSGTANMHGVLDVLGDATASITLPAGVPAALQGHTFFLAAIASKPGQLPEYSSSAVALEITP